MIKILDCKNSNYLSRLKLILNKRRFKSKINTDIVIKIVKDIKKNKIFLLLIERLNKEKDSKEKIKSICKFEFVDDVKSKNIDQNNKDNILELMAINLFKVEEKFEITLLFKNNAFITLLTEVLEVTLEDQNKLND